MHYAFAIPSPRSDNIHSLVYLLILFSLWMGVSHQPVLAQPEEGIRAFSSLGSQSPTAASLGRYGEVPINLYRGTPDITIPLYKVEAQTHKLPIRLRYDASGVKVGKVASWVGQNWTLQAGGIISRTMRGIPDERGYISDSCPDVWPGDWGGGEDREKLLHLLEQKYPTIEYVRVGRTWGFDLTDVNYFESVSNRDCDSEPDQFFFNVRGLTGKFVFNEDSGHSEQIVRTSRGKPIRLSYNIDGGSITEWTLWDPSGKKYIFSVEETSYVGSNGYTSSWYLTTIVPASGNEDSIELNYTSGEQVNIPQGGRVIKRDRLKDHNYDEECPFFGQKLWSDNDRTYRARFLKSIMSNQVRVELHPSKDRDDLLTSGERKLDSVRVERDGEWVKSFKFVHEYFERGEEKTRLKLDEVEELGRSSTSDGSYEFVYNEIDPPGYESSSIDHWGYFNGGGDGLIPSVTYNGNYYPGEAYRSPSSSMAKAGILKKIEYPTGGYVNFYYELHEYGEILGGSLNEEKEAGGLRIRKVEKNPLSGSPPVTKTYSYSEEGESSGVLVSEPIYVKRNSRAECYQECSSGGCRYFVTYCPVLTRWSSSRVPLGQATGGHVGYRQVTVRTKKGGVSQGKEIHDFRASGRTPPDDQWPRVPLPAQNWSHGHKESVSTYNQAGNLLRIVRFGYSVNKDHPEVRGLRVQGIGSAVKGTSRDGDEQCLPDYKANKYSIQSGRRRRTIKKTTYYQPNGDTLSVTKRYRYDQETHQVRTVTESTTSGRSRTTRYTYAYEQYPQMDASGSHQLSQKYRTTVFEDADDNGQVGSDETVWKRSWTEWMENIYGHWVPESEWVWTGESDQ